VLLFVCFLHLRGSDQNSNSLALQRLLLILELFKTIQALIKSVAVNICCLVVTAMVWYILRETPLGTSSLLIPFLLGKLAYVGIIVFIGMIILDISDNIAPFASSEITKRYKGKRAVNWDALVKTVVSIVVLTVMWAVLATSFQSLVGSLKSWVNPDTLVLSYNLLFVVVLAYVAIVGTIQSRSPSSTQSVVIGDEVVYEKLHGEYEKKLREAIESP
jgi:hypothetical protein